MALNPDHILEHDDISALVNAQSARFGRAQLLPIVNLEGDPGHLTLHNSIRAELAAIATAAGKTYTVALPPVRSLGESGHAPEDHEAYRVAVVEAATWPAWNSATGGTIADKTNYNGTGQKWRVHKFTANGTLNVSIAAQPFSVVVGGGGGGSGQNAQGAAGGKGGDGQGVQKTSQTLATGSHAVVVGVGGAGGPADGWGQGNGSSGGVSSLGTITATGGGGGYGPGDQNHPQNPADGSPNGPTVTSTITGTSATYGGAGGPRPYDHPARPGNAGAAGVVIVAYRIG
jgi:hypothetical protein